MASMPRELSGWETGTICVTKPIRVEPVEGSDFDWREKKLLLSTLEAKEKLSSRHATLEGNTLVYDVDEDEPIRLPTYDRYSSALYFDYGGSKIHISKFGKVRDAFATCCELHDPVGTPDLELTSLSGRFAFRAERVHRWRAEGSALARHCPEDVSSGAPRQLRQRAMPQDARCRNCRVAHDHYRR